MKLKCNKKFLINFFIILFCFTYTSAFAENIEKITYSEDYETQPNIDEELFDEESEYEEYVVYTEVDDSSEDTTEMIILAPENSVRKKVTTLHATIEKAYSFRAVEAFNTIWDSSDNFRTMYRTVPSMMQTAPSVIHAAHYRFMPDEYTQVYWGHSALSSFDGVSVGFVGKLESDYDSGLKINTRIGKVNVSTAIYESLETNNPSGGLLISSDELSFGKMKGTIKFGGGVYTNENENFKSSYNSGGLFAKYSLGRFSLGAQIGKTQFASSKGRYGTSFYLYPTIKLTNSLFLKSKFAAHIDQKYMQEEIGLTYKPYRNNPNEFSISLNASLFNGSGTTTKQRLKLSTEFKL